MMLFSRIGFVRLSTLALLPLLASCRSAGDSKAPAPPGSGSPGASGTPVKAAGKADTIRESVVLHLAKGNVVIQLFEEDCPLHAENFKKTVRSGFYDGTSFFRTCFGFVQAGDPSGTGKGGKGDHMPPEIKHPHVRGALVEALDTQPSQFLIMKVAHPAFDGQYTVFGQVIQGMEIIDGIPEAEAGADDLHLVPAGQGEKILKAEVVPAPGN